MFKLVVVLPMLLAAASAGLVAPVAGTFGYSTYAAGAYAAPAAYGYAAAPAAYGAYAAPAAYGAYAAPAVYGAYASPALKTIASPLAYSAQLAVAQPLVKTIAAPAVAYSAPVAVAQPLVRTVAAPAVAYSAPVAVAQPIVRAVATQVSVPVTKTVHYANTPVVTGYSSQILKPAFPGGAGLATPAEIVSKQAVIAPARAVQTVIPQVTRVEPEVEVRKVPVDVPVQRPYPVEQVVRTVAAPAVIPAPAVAVRTIAAAPVAYAAAPALAYKSFAAPAPLAYSAQLVKTIAAPAPLAYSTQVVKTVASPVAYAAAPALSNVW